VPGIQTCCEPTNWQVLSVWQVAGLLVSHSCRQKPATQLRPVRQMASVLPVPLHGWLMLEISVAEHAQTPPLGVVWHAAHPAGLAGLQDARHRPPKQTEPAWHGIEPLQVAQVVPPLEG